MTDDNETKTVLRFGGTVDLTTIADAHQAIRTALAEHADVAIDVGDIAETDLSFIQLIESARRTAAERGKMLALTAPASGVLYETLTRGGFIKPGTDGARFWLGQGE